MRPVRKRDANGTTDNAATDRMPSLGQRWSKPAPRIDVKFPILGFLMESEMSGYGLRRTFAESVGFFYRASDGSLYPALKKLARDGMVTVRVERQGRRVRKVYAITPGGRRWFVRMLGEASPPVSIEDEAMVKLYFAHHRPAVALEHLERMRRRDAQSAAELERIERELEQTDINPFRRMMVEIGRRITAFKAEMLADMETRLMANETLKRPAPGAAKSRRESAG
jgi:DNA-binding PadR family transcriptional regulator